MTSLLVLLALGVGGDTLSVLLLPSEGASPEIYAAAERTLLDVEGMRVTRVEDVEKSVAVEVLKDAAVCDSVTCFSEISGALDTDYLVVVSADAQKNGAWVLRVRLLNGKGSPELLSSRELHGPEETRNSSELVSAAVHLALADAGFDRSLFADLELAEAKLSVGPTCTKLLSQIADYASSKEMSLADSDFGALRVNWRRRCEDSLLSVFAKHHRFIARGDSEPDLAKELESMILLLGKAMEPYLSYFADRVKGVDEARALRRAGFVELDERHASSRLRGICKALDLRQVSIFLTQSTSGIGKVAGVRFPSPDVVTPEPFCTRVGVQLLARLKKFEQQKLGRVARARKKRDALRETLSFAFDLQTATSNLLGDSMFAINRLTR